MEVTGKSFGIFRLTPSLPPTRRFCTTLLLAKKKDIQDNKNESQPQQPPFLSFSVSNSNLARAAIGIFALGFIDAGYSGDWSRIGAITPQAEELLRLAAFLVVPICVFFIFSLPKQPN
ncbi:DNA-directed RNA polymerase subunit beta [Trifolium repens]|nr:DNA-directed RNA polymerase subunit beta [Trifolium repens]